MQGCYLRLSIHGTISRLVLMAFGVPRAAAVKNYQHVYAVQCAAVFAWLWADTTSPKSDFPSSSWVFSFYRVKLVVARAGLRVVMIYFLKQVPR